MAWEVNGSGQLDWGQSEVGPEGQASSETSATQEAPQKKNFGGFTLTPAPAAAASKESEKGGWSKGGWSWDKGGKGGWVGWEKGGWGGWDKGGWGGWDKGKGKMSGGKGCGKDGGGKSKTAMKLAAGETLYYGRVKMFNVEKSHGYIVSEQAFGECGQDVYAFKDVLERGKAGPGDGVAFFIHWSSKGQPQASSPLVRLQAGNGEDGQFALKGKFKAGQGAQGFGFFECDDTKEFFGRDVYVNKDLAALLEPGSYYAFNAFLNNDGMPNAKNTVEPVDESWEPFAGDLTFSMENEEVAQKGKALHMKGGSKGWGSSGGKMDWSAPAAKGAGKMYAPAGGVIKVSVSPGAKGSSKGWSDGWSSGWSKGGAGGCGGGSSGAGKPTSTGQVHSGFIKSFSEKNNYGFIDCEEVKAEFGNDVFVHGIELKGMNVGDAVFFELAMSSKGQPQALKVQSADTLAIPGEPLAIAGQPAAKKQRTGVEGSDPFAAAGEDMWATLGEGA